MGDERLLAWALHFLLCSLCMDVGIIQIMGGIIHDAGAGEGDKSKDFKFEFKPKFKSSAISYVPQ